MPSAAKTASVNESTLVGGDAHNLTPAGVFLPQFVPIADRDATTLFIDTRAGDLFGCVTEYVDESADDGGPLWGSLTAMLTDLADSLEAGTVFLRYQPAVVTGELIWERAHDPR